MQPRPGAATVSPPSFFLGRAIRGRCYRTGLIGANGTLRLTNGPRSSNSKQCMHRACVLLLLLSVNPAIARGVPLVVRPHARFAETVVYQSTGRITFATGSKDRDRTITLVPVDHDGLVATLDTTIVDHVDDDFTYRGVLNVDEGGGVSTREMQMVNAANILVVSPQVIHQLAAGAPEVVTDGHIEVSEDVLPVRCTHRLEGNPHDLPLRVITQTRTADGKVNLETRAAFGPDGLPLSAHTTGTIRALIEVSLDLTLTRKATLPSTATAR